MQNMIPPFPNFLLLLKRGFKISWSQINEPTYYFQFQLENGFKMFWPQNIAPPPLFLFALQLDKGFKMSWLQNIEFPMIFFCHWKGGSKYFGSDILNHSLIFSSNGKGGGQNIMAVKYRNYPILNDISYFEHTNQLPCMHFWLDVCYKCTLIWPFPYSPF